MASRFFASFRNATRGLYHLLNQEMNFRLHVILALLLLAAIVCLRLTYTEAGFIIIAIILVLGSEAVNTVIERIMNSVSLERKQWIGDIKDMMASAVLLNSVGALCIGVVTILHYAMRVMGITSLSGLDISFFFSLNAWAGQTALGDAIITFFAATSGFILLFIFLFVIILSHISSRQKIYRIFVGGISMLVSRYGVTELIRFLHPRPRPFISYQVHQLIVEHGNSFPSGHASFFFALSAAVFCWNKRLGICFFVVSILMGIARVMAGVHYPSDIIAGMVVGIASAWLVTYVLSMYKKR